MSALLPVQTATRLREGISEYLSTTFALADRRTQVALEKFVAAGATSMFRGPYVRTRMPFAPAGEGALDCLDWAPQGFTPYGHQAAAFARLSSTPDAEGNATPSPTLVVTGTGSGKTEAFLLPLLDHARRERAQGRQGIKALLLYPMNALATDQAERLARMLSEDSALAAVTAGIYTGEFSSGGRTKVSAEGIITDRRTMQANPPDLLLTNYKMLDQLLLRERDADLWRLSADSLQYLVLDEFHTYDGAQGTDVALLLRRLGMTLARHRSGDVDANIAALPLGPVTPIATSATLGDEGDTSEVRDFAETVFGRPFAPESVVTESRQTVEEWAGPVERWLTEFAGNVKIAEALVTARGALEEGGDPADALFGAFCEHVLGLGSGTPDIRSALEAAKKNELVQAIFAETTKAVELAELAERVLPVEYATNAEDTVEFVALSIGALGHIRAAITAVDPWAGRQIPSIEAHLWVRELSRIERSVTTGGIDFRWHDDGPEGFDLPEDAAHENFAAQQLPAIFCRHCGRAGWMTAYEQGTHNPLFAPQKIRQLSLSDKAQVRALISADQEVQSARENDIPLSETRAKDSASTALRWLDSGSESFGDADSVDLSDIPPGVVPVLMHSGQDAKKSSEDQTCPACDSRDSIRYIGSAVATLLSVALSNMFGTAGLDAGDKKALVFADSVQDASHRAGFVQARSHAFSLRTAMTNALGEDDMSLSELSLQLRREAKTPVDCYHLLHPTLVERASFRPYWDRKPSERPPRAVLDRVNERLAFDVCLEYGLRQSVGRTLSLTGTSVAQVSADDDGLAAIARQAWDSTAVESQLDAQDPDSSILSAWARVVLERIRQRGGILHKWLDTYIKEDGNTYHLIKAQSKARGVPGFPVGGWPVFPRVGPSLPDTKYMQGTDPVASRRSWYARWTAKHLGVTTDSAQKLVKELLAQLAERNVLSGVTTSSGATSYGLDMAQVTVTTEDDPGELRCTTCHNATPAPLAVRTALAGVPCLNVDCGGHVEPRAIPDNYYRRLYRASDARAVVSREHTSLLQTKDRAELEKQFKTSSEKPGAPNVLVATPTLEMGIDIGDLSSVMLSSLPRTVANYVQRVGRAGRLTGNSLVVALLQGRGENLPVVQDPLSMINGAVRPPAAFLSAAEILRRQYIAHAVGSAMLDGALPEVTLARDVFASHANTLVSVLRALLGEKGEAWLDGFLAALDGQLSEHAVDGLRAWVAGTGEGHSLDSTLALAADRWRKERETLQHRIEKLDATIPELEARVASAAKSDEDVEAYRSAKSSRKALAMRSADLANEPWIASMERFGLLPSYRLLDDDVSLEASIQSQDPDTFEWDTSKRTIQRGLSSALTEFAPGNTFYADRMRIRIDSVELGPEGEGVEQWRVCAACSFAETVDAAKGAAAPTSCPACGDASFADMSQLLDVVPLRKVSAQVKRDSSTIDERDEDRVRRRYNVAHTMSHSEHDVVGQWFVEQTGFGAKYLRQADIRWINLGYGSGAQVLVGSDAVPAPLFRLCEYCGHQDSGVGTNTRADHRPWCPHATSATEHNRAVALGRSLRTEGVVLRLPASISGLDAFIVPSLIAAIKLGFRTVLGGNPDHLDVVSISVPQDTGVAPALLLHDTVPGGTGYLADFASPERVWELLFAAWETARDCPCAGESRLACPRCLLSHTAPGLAERTSREVAEGVLYRLLCGSSEDDGDIPDFSRWSITDIPPDVDESALEVAFRHAFEKLLVDSGAKVTTVPNGMYSKLRFTVPQTDVTWELEAQVDISEPGAKTRPDFVLRRTDGGPRKFAIYTDGYRFHAVKGTNRLADDARKRAALRDRGWIPWGLTWADVERAQAAGKGSAAPGGKGSDGQGVDGPGADAGATWFERRMALGMAKMLGLKPDVVEIAARDHVALLVRLLQDEPKVIDPAGGAARDLGNVAMALACMRGDGDFPDRHLARPFARMDIHGSPKTPHTLSIDLRVDYSETAVAADDFRRDWQWWLHMSNLASLREDPARTTVHAVAQGGAAGGGSEPAEASTAGEDTAPPTSGAVVFSNGAAGTPGEDRAAALSPEWAEALETYDEDAEDADEALEARLVRLFGEADLPMPELGEEIDGQVTVASWNDHRIVVVVSDPEDNLSNIKNNGGIVFYGTDPDIVEKVSAELARDGR